MKNSETTTVKRSLSPLNMIRALVSAGIAAAFLAIGLPCSQAADTDPIWRLQLKVAVADVAYAGTDAIVYVDFNSDAVMALNSSDNDFEKGSEFTYELLFSEGQPVTFADIEYLRLQTLSLLDPFAVSKIELIVNEKTVYSADYGSSGTMVYMGKPILVTGTTLRASFGWKHYAFSYPSTSIPVERLELGIEGLIGNAIVGTEHEASVGTIDIKWGTGSGRGVEFSRYDSSQHSVDLDLAVTGKKGNTESSMDVDMRLKWTLTFDPAGNALLTIDPTITSIDVDWAGLAGVVEWTLSWTSLEDTVYSILEDYLNGQMEAVEIPLGVTKSQLDAAAKLIYTTARGFVYRIEVNSSGDLELMVEPLFVRL